MGKFFSVTPHPYKCGVCDLAIRLPRHWSRLHAGGEKRHELDRESSTCRRQRAVLPPQCFGVHLRFEAPGDCGSVDPKVSSLANTLGRLSVQAPR